MKMGGERNWKMGDTLQEAGKRLGKTVVTGPKREVASKENRLGDRRTFTTKGKKTLRFPPVA